MIPSHQYHPWLNSFLILVLLRFHHSTGVGGARFTIVNRCSQPIWPVVQDKATQDTAEYELTIGSSIAFQRPYKWNGRVWAKSGCIFNESGNASCATGDSLPYTLAEFQVGSPGSMPLDFYDASLVNGFNLPLLITPSSSPPCNSTGCTEDLNQRCPPQLRTEGGASCLGPCFAFNTTEYCCPEGPASCGPTNYSRVFKKACPTAYSYVFDDATSLFTCTAADYSITFCPPSNSLLGELPTTQGMPPAPAPSPSNTNPQQTKGENRAKEIITIVSLSLSGVIVVFIIICCFLKTRQHSQNDHNRKCNRDVENLLLQYGSLAPKRYRYSEIKKITKSLSDKLGHGGYGSVYKGILPDGRLVAVKILIEADSNGEEFINEVASISRTSHVNVVTLLGFCYEGNKRALVYEFMPNKSLDKFLSNNGSADCFLDLKKLYTIAVGIAKGLEYLHTGCITRIVHFDIKPQNILLDEEFCPKISDFGLAKLCKKKQSILSVLGTRGTAGYIAPEVFSRNFGGVSHKSDVYSYGMMLLEMAGAKKATLAEAIQSSEDYFPDKIYEEVIVDVSNNLHELMMEEDEGRRKKMFMVGFWCIQTIPSDRPSISKVVEMLEGNLEAIQIPPKPFLFTPAIPDLQTSSSLSDNLSQD